MKKNIIFVGKTGSGKSTVANMISTHSLDKPFYASDSARGASLKCDASRANPKWNVYDTAGFGEPFDGSVSDVEAEKQLQQFVNDTFISFNYVCFVMEQGRLTAEDETVFACVRKIFKGDLEQNIVLVVTHSSDEWIQKNQYNLNNAFGDIPMIAVDFPPINGRTELENVYREERIKSLYRIEHFFEYWNFPPRSPPPIMISGLFNYFKVLIESIKKGWRLGKHHGYEGFRYAKNAKYAFSSSKR